MIAKKMSPGDEENSLSFIRMRIGLSLGIWRSSLRKWWHTNCNDIIIIGIFKRKVMREFVWLENIPDRAKNKIRMESSREHSKKGVPLFLQVILQNTKSPNRRISLIRCWNNSSFYGGRIYWIVALSGISCKLWKASELINIKMIFTLIV